MRWIGLTGGIASGKSSVSRLLVARGFPVVDADQLAREVVAKGAAGYDEVLSAFGPDAVATNGELNRQKIGEVVFADRAKLTQLEAIIHPRVRTLAEAKRRELERSGYATAFYDVPLLFEKKMQAIFDEVVVVACSVDTQLARLIARDGLKREQAAARLAAQMPLPEKTRAADYVILNEGSLAELEEAVAKFVARL